MAPMVPVNALERGGTLAEFCRKWRVRELVVPRSSSRNGCSMPLEPRDAAYLWDMVETGKAVSAFTSGVKPHGYLADRKLQMAVERAVEIVGEAARRVSDSFKADHPRSVALRVPRRIGLPPRTAAGIAQHCHYLLAH